jgi:RNA polymerase sigma factor (sigma-70 family)
VNTLTDQQLLRDYSGRGSEPAFAELVRRHVDFVYSAALRMLRDPHLAEDVTQGVFVALARSAPQLADHPVLSGWLHRTAQNLAAKNIRTDARRRAREQEAAAMNELLSAKPDADWEHVAPHLDAALGELEGPDRDALLLRYFARKSAREMAQALGVSDEAAQKRVSRAVERLRELFAKRGVTVGAGGLAVVITANAVQAAPAGLSATISAAVVAGTTVTTATLATHAIMNWITLKSAAAITVAALAAGTGTYLWQQHEAGALRGENADLAAQRDSLTKERDDAVAAAAAQNSRTDGLQADQEELLRLRSEVGMLRRQTNEIDRLRQQNAELQSSLAAAKQSTQDPEDPAKQMAIAKMNNAKQIGLGVLMYADDHQNQYPTDFSQLTNYFKNADDAAAYNSQFEIVVQGSTTNLSDAANTLAVRERQPWLSNGKWVKAYGFADGHAVIMAQPPEGFDAWEQQHMMPLPVSNQ